MFCNVSFTIMFYGFSNFSVGDCPIFWKSCLAKEFEIFVAVKNLSFSRSKVFCDHEIALILNAITWFMLPSTIPWMAVENFNENYLFVDAELKLARLKAFLKAIKLRPTRIENHFPKKKIIDCLQWYSFITKTVFQHLFLRFLLHLGKSRDCCREAFVGNVNGCDQERDQNAQLHIEIVEVCPALIEAEENCGCCHHVNGNAGKTVAGFEHGRFDDVSQLEAVLCQGSTERGRHGEQISDKAEQTVSRLIVRIAIAVLVDVDRRLGDSDQHQGDRLDHPMRRDTLLMVVALREHVLIGHRENAVRHQNQILNERYRHIKLDKIFVNFNSRRSPSDWDATSREWCREV